LTGLTSNLLYILFSVFFALFVFLLLLRKEYKKPVKLVKPPWNSAIWHIRARQKTTTARKAAATNKASPSWQLRGLTRWTHSFAALYLFSSYT
jgi:hypothetical protein